MRKDAGKYIGIDVGGTKIAAGLVDAGSWGISKLAQRPTEASLGRSQVIANILAAASEVVGDKDKVKGIGIAFAAATDYKHGRIIRGPNFPSTLDGFPLAKEIEKRLKKPVTIDNDAKCFTLAESTIGVAKGKNSVFGMTLGTGIGGGLVVDGRIYRGKNNAAGEVGHSTVAMGSEMECGCGQFGHFEAMASGSSMHRLAERIMGDDLSATGVIEAADAGDRGAKAIIEVFRESLAVGLANIAYFYDPDVIVMGGGVANHEDLWRPAVARACQRIIYPGVSELVVRRSKLGHRANIIGAAMLAATR